MSSVPFAIVDVFGERSLTGNPLAVVDLTGCAGAVGDAWLAAVAREFHQAETTFVLPGGDGADRLLRSFTMGGVEVYGAGHNALGAWCWLLDSGRIAAPAAGGSLVQRIGERVLPVEVQEGGWLAMRQQPPRFGSVARASDVRAALGLTGGDILDVPPPQVVDTGAAHLMALVCSRAGISTAAPDLPRLARLAASLGAEGVYVAWLDGGAPGAAGTVAHARFFNPGVGLNEDSATGTAAGPLAAHLGHAGLLDPPGRLTIFQGEDMWRPSTLRVTLAADGAPVLAGRGFTTMEGTLRLA